MRCSSMAHSFVLVVPKDRHVFRTVGLELINTPPVMTAGNVLMLYYIHDGWFVPDNAPGMSLASIKPSFIKYVNIGYALALDSS